MFYVARNTRTSETRSVAQALENARLEYMFPPSRPSYLLLLEGFGTVEGPSPIVVGHVVAGTQSVSESPADSTIFAQ